MKKVTAKGKKDVEKVFTGKPKVIHPIVENLSTGKTEKVIIDTVRPEFTQVSDYPVFAKVEVLTQVPIPVGHIRAEVLKDYKGMEDDLYEGDVLDLPERRFKTLANRGLVIECDKTRYPNKVR